MAIGLVRSDTDYARSWRDLRRREATFLIVVVSYLPAFALATLVVHLFRYHVPQQFVIWVAGGWIAGYLAASVYCGAFRCPRCHHLFFHRADNQGAPARACTHCRLPRWAPQDPDASKL
jgi:hypothetical protein